MNYPESQIILEEIKNAKRILVNCHRGPDADSVGSALAMQKVIENLGLSVDVICPSEIPDDLHFLNKSNNIKIIDYTNFNFSDYELFITLDSSTYGMVSGDKSLELPNIKIIVIDHHYTNTKFGSLNLVDEKTTSTAELLFKIFEDWDIKFDKDIATDLLTGILGDTGCFQYTGVGKETLQIASKLIDFGAQKDNIVLNIYKTVEFKTVKFWGKIIENMQKDDNFNFVWSAVPNSVYKEFGEDISAKEDASNLLAPIVNNTDFGLIMVESSLNVLSVSFRSRNGFDVSKIAQEIGGGGHIVASGAKVEGKFDEAVEKVLIACRKYANKNI